MGLEWGGDEKPPSDTEILFWLILIIAAILIALALS